MRALTDRLRSLWSAEHNLTTLLVTLLLLLLLPGLGASTGPAFTVASNILLSILLLAGVLTLTRYRALRLLCWVLVTVAIVARWLYVSGWVPSALGPGLLLTLFSLLAIAWVVLLQVSRAGPVTAHHVRGAVALYLLIAAIFAYAYAYLEMIRPGAFQRPDWWTPQLSHRPEAYYYFSVVTLTTLGYGDVTAVDPGARDLVMLEALLGQLFPAIIIARLVTLELHARQSAAATPHPRSDGPRKAPGASPPGSGRDDPAEELKTVDPADNCS